LGHPELKADKNKIECEIEKLKRQIDIEFVKVSKELQEGDGRYNQCD